MGVLRLSGPLGGGPAGARPPPPPPPLPPATGLAFTTASSSASHASYWRRSSSSRWIAAALFDGPLGIKPQRLLLPDQPGGKDYSRAVLQTLHPDPSLIKGFTHGHRAMIGEQ